MLWGTLVLLVVAVAIVAYVLQPLWIAHRRLSEDAPWPAVLLDLFAERDVILMALRDLQLDYETGKVSPGDYRKMRSSLLAEAARVLRAIEDVNRELEASIEDEIAHLRELAKKVDSTTSTSAAVALSCGIRLRRSGVTNRFSLSKDGPSGTAGKRRWLEWIFRSFAVSAC